MTVILVICFWITGITCVWVMKKIEPDNKLYPILALGNVIAFTLFAISKWFSWLG